MKTATRIVIATDVRFWHRSTGAQQRIASIVDHLQVIGMEVTSLFAAPIADANKGIDLLTERKKIHESGYRVLSLVDDWKPIGLWNRIFWQLQCIGNQVKPKSGVGNARYSGQRQSRNLSEMISPLFRIRSQQMIMQIDPDNVIVEYVTLAYLVPDSRKSNPRPKYLVDTHDVLCERNRQFKARGHSHWIDISAEEEAIALQKFDAIVAIQNLEARTFAQMTDSRVEIIVAGHPVDGVQPVSIEETVNAKYCLGYFGSDNPSNADAVKWFLDNVWIDVKRQLPDATLLIAGSICSSFAEAESQSIPGLSFQDTVDNKFEFYRLFKIAINPVQFGTGLKIKNQEALAYGKPLVVTSQGAQGMVRTDGRPAWMECPDARSMEKQLVAILTQPDLIRQTATAAIDYAQRVLSSETVFRDLIKCLQSPE